MLKPFNVLHFAALILRFTQVAQNWQNSQLHSAG